MREFSKLHGFGLDMDEWDILRDPTSDLSSAQAWEPIFAKLESGYDDVLLLSPPCGTYSRARHCSLGKGGPVPLRSFTYPWGFPWLSNANRLKVDLANFFIKQCLRAISLQIQCSKFWLLERPEDLGQTTSGEVPGSIWQLPELHELVSQGGTTWAIHQCTFGAATSKPARLASNLPAFLHVPCSWPLFDPQRNYLGPLGSCPHGFHPPLVGFRDGRFMTSGAEAYPDLMCKYIAQAIIESVSGSCTGDVSEPPSLPPCWPFHAPSSGPVFGLASSSRRCTQSHTSSSWRCILCWSISSGRFVRPALHLQLTPLLHPVLYPAFAGDVPQSGFHLLWHLLQCVDFHAQRLA